MFPLGTEMTEVEQELAGRLTFLKSAGYADLIGTLVAGLARTPASSQEKAALERLGLQAPAALRDRILRAVVRGAMRRGG
jgi:hypothetical protein